MRWRVLLCCLILAGFVQPAASQQLNQFVGLGDSTIDTGWYRNDTTGSMAFDGAIAAALPNAGNFTEAGGLMSPDILAAYFGIPGAQPANAGGTNFATGGARSALDNAPGDGLFQGAVPLTTQIANYLAGNGGVANPDALYLISIGGNDIGYALNKIATEPAALDYLDVQANLAAVGVAQLQGLGARYIVVPNQPESLGNNQTAKDYRAAYNDALWGALKDAEVNFIPADVNAVRLAIQADPSGFGFQFVGPGAPACTPGADPLDSAFALFCSPDKLVSPDAGTTHLFADDQHLTTAGHKIMGDYYYSLVLAPSQISLLPETAVKARTGLVSSIQTQIEATRQRPGAAGINFWVTGDVSGLQTDNAPGFAEADGAPTALFAGMSFRLGAVIVGGAVSTGHLKAGYGDGRGHFEQDEIAGSVYAALAGGPLWGTLIGSYGGLEYDVNRLVPVGITVQSNFGSTEGTNASLALQGGYDFRYGFLTHGPVAGLTWQRAEVDGFAETGTFTHLAFAGQTRDSAIASLGWRATLDLGTLRPFGQLVWKHELASTDRNITTSLLTTDAPSYVMPGMALGKDWGTATVGVNVLLGAGVTGLAAVSADFGDGQDGNYSAQAGINVAF
jgi:outer membrane lipase/esterase